MLFPIDVWRHIVSFLNIKDCPLYKSLYEGDKYFEKINQLSLFAIANKNPDMHFQLYFYYFALSNIKLFAEHTCRVKLSMLNKTIDTALRWSNETPSEYLKFIDYQKDLISICEDQLKNIKRQNGIQIFNDFSTSPSFTQLLRFFQNACYHTIVNEFTTYQGKEIHSIVKFLSNDMKLMQNVESLIIPGVDYIKKSGPFKNDVFHNDSRPMIIILSNDEILPYVGSFRRLIDIQNKNESRNACFCASDPTASFNEFLLERTRYDGTNLYTMDWFARECYSSGYCNKNFQRKQKLSKKSLSTYEKLYRLVFKTDDVFNELRYHYIRSMVPYTADMSAPIV